MAICQTTETRCLHNQGKKQKPSALKNARRALDCSRELIQLFNSFLRGASRLKSPRCSYKLFPVPEVSSLPPPPSAALAAPANSRGRTLQPAISDLRRRLQPSFAGPCP